MSEYTYHIPDSKSFVFTLKEYLKKTNPKVRELLEEADCSINPSSSYSGKRWNAFLTSITYYLVLDNFSKLSDHQKNIIYEATTTIFPQEAGYDIFEVDFSPKLLTPYDLGASSNSLRKIIDNKDLKSLDDEFNRSLESVESDPPSAVTAACAILESLCKIYIEDEKLEMPNKMTIQPLWSTVQEHIGLKPRNDFEKDINKILSGMISVVQGIGDLRTHMGSAHGRGRISYKISERHARLAIHAAHTLAVFILETWENRKNTK